MANKSNDRKSKGKFSQPRNRIQQQPEQSSLEPLEPELKSPESDFLGSDQAPELESASRQKSKRQDPPKKAKKVKKAKKKGSPMKVVAVLLAILLFIECAYCLVIFTDLIPPIARLRSIYIETAMSTMRHQWLAKALIPGDIVQNVIDSMNKAKEEQVGVNSGWDDVTEPPTEEPKSPSSGFSKDTAAAMLSLLAQDIGLSNSEDDFFELFHELDEESTRAFAESHPEAISAGWENFYVNEAGLDDDGTSILTTQGDQVLAIDAANGLMVIRITGSTYRGVLVIGKDASRLKCAPSSYGNSMGERAGEIAGANNGLVAMTGSGFADLPGQAEGSSQTGAAMFSGVTRGYHCPYGYKRVELHKDNRLYITDAYTQFGENCTDATEWEPALIVDGTIVVTDRDGYTALNPRACLGQTKDEAIMFLGIEGRSLVSAGCNANECALILNRYGAYQAMNVDGGSSATVWYEGEYIMRCGNGTVEGRRLPNAWVYCDSTVPDSE